jgi:hypothetical protein
MNNMSYNYLIEPSYCHLATVLTWCRVEEIREAAFVYVPNLIRRATDLIEEHRGWEVGSRARGGGLIQMASRG